jgi:hypothetical protein
MKYPTMDWGTMEAVVNKLGGMEGVGQLLRGEMKLVMKKVEATVVSILTFVKTITAPAVAGKKTNDCFTSKSRYCYRDDDLDNWLPENQPEQIESKFSVMKIKKSATFKQVVESFLEIKGDIKLLSQALKERGHTTTLPVIESLIERQEGGEDVLLRTDGWASFFFVEDDEGGVSVVRVRRLGRQWYVGVYTLGSVDVWCDDLRFFFRD